MDQSKNEKKICPLVWGRLSLSPQGKAILCCHQDNVVLADNPESYDVNLPSLKDMRSQMLRGELPRECRVCKEMESAGLKSYREDYRESFKTSNKDLIAMTTPGGHYEGSLEEMDLSLGNLCNLKCRMCSSLYSSKYCSEPSSVHDGSFIESLKKDHFERVRKITIAGGEPLITKSFYDLLQNLVDWNLAPQIDLFIHTNMSIWPEEKLGNLKFFNRVDICVSFDGVGKVVEYIREPLIWQDFDDSYQMAMRFSYEVSNIFISNSITLQVFNLFDLKNIFEYIYKFEGPPKINLNLLASPSCYSLMCLPKEVLIEALKEIEDLTGEDIESIRTQIQRIIDSSFHSPWDPFSLLATFKTQDHERRLKLSELNFYVIKLLSEY